MHVIKCLLFCHKILTSLLRRQIVTYTHKNLYSHKNTHLYTFLTFACTKNYIHICTCKELYLFFILHKIFMYVTYNMTEFCCCVCVCGDTKGKQECTQKYKDEENS